MIEVELKGLVDDVARRRALVEAAGGVLTFSGRLEDRRYDTAERALVAADHVLRVRVYRDAHGTRAQMDWKGPTTRRDGFKLREELEARVEDADALVAILERLGYRVVMAIDREIQQYELAGAMVRFERYPRMDDLVEVEGTPESIEHAISVLGITRAAFTADRLPDFARRFEARTGISAALSYASLAGPDRFANEDG